MTLRSFSKSTLKQQKSIGSAEESDQEAEPGLVLVFSAGRPALVPISGQGGTLVVGREHTAIDGVLDPTMSRRHARVEFDRGSGFRVADLGSQNGTFVDGSVPSREFVGGRVLRMGESVFLLVRDLRPFRGFGIRVDGQRAEGPALQRALLSIAQLAHTSRTLCILGESGAGKESAAQAFHRTRAQLKGPFVAVNCAAIPEGVAERLLFGAVRGAYSGATAEADGYLQAAHQGTLFLDEIGDLDLGVQAKLLRVLETGEVLRLGSTRPTRVALRICVATHKELSELVAAGRFRQDLYFRIGIPSVRLPPLRERLEEIPWHIASALKVHNAALGVEASLIEACLLSAWPGNVRELLAAIRTAAAAAFAGGSVTLRAHHLGPEIVTAEVPEADSAKPARLPPRAASPPPWRVRQALERSLGNVSAAARSLGLHRTNLRRLLARHGISAEHYREPAEAKSSGRKE